MEDHQTPWKGRRSTRTTWEGGALGGEEEGRSQPLPTLLEDDLALQHLISFANQPACSTTCSATSTSFGCEVDQSSRPFGSCGRELAGWQEEWSTPPREFISKWQWWQEEGHSWMEVSLLQWTAVSLEGVSQQGGVQGQRRRGKVGEEVLPLRG